MAERAVCNMITRWHRLTDDENEWRVLPKHDRHSTACQSEAELEAYRKEYAYYRDKLLALKEKTE